MFCIRRFGLFALVLLLMLTTTAVPASRAALLEAQPQGPAGTAFTYQGQLNSAGTPVNASCDFQFSLWDDAAAGTQMGATLAPTLNVVDGLFTATLDFGDQFTGDARWLEIALQCPGDPGVTVLSPRTALLGVPYANGLRPGISVTDSTTGSSALIAVPDYGLAGSSGGATGVYGSSIHGTGVNGVSTNSTGVLGETQAAVEAGVRGTNSAASGIGVRGEANATGGVGVWGQSNANTGVYGLSTSGSGVWGQSTSGDAIYAVSANGAGVLATSTSYFGVSGSTNSASLAGVHGVNLSTGLDGSGVSGSSTNGPGVKGTSDSGYGVKATSTYSYGVYGTSTNASGVRGFSTYGSGVLGLTVASNQPGVRGFNPESSGIGVHGEANATGSIGVWGESRTNTGVYGLSTDGNGVWGQSTNGIAVRAVSTNNWAGYFAGNVYVSGGCTGCLLANFAVNAGEHPLQPGDVVSIQSTTPTDFDTGPVLWQVTQAEPGQAVVGVVAGRAELVAASEHQPDETGKRLVPREGAAQPGEYVSIVYNGPMRVKVAGSVAAGEKLAVGEDGNARRVRKIEVGGVPVAEDAPVLGIALSEPQDGRVWVLVNPQ